MYPFIRFSNGDDGGNPFQSNLNNRVEVKNLNSLRQVQQAADYEVVRQAAIVAGDVIDNNDDDDNGTPKNLSRNPYVSC